MRNWNVLIIALCSILVFSTAPAYAVSIEETLPYVGDPVNQWIVVSNSTGLSLTRAEIKKTPSSLMVVGEVSELGAESVSAGVVMLENGEVVSSSLHSVGKNELSTKSSQVALEQVDDLKNRIGSVKGDIARLEKGVTDLNQALRKEAGLQEVDNIYDKIAEIDRQISELSGIERGF